MIKYKSNHFLFYLSILIAFGCNGKSNKPNETEIIKQDSIQTNIHWINEELGIKSDTIISDTTILEDDAMFAYGAIIVLPALVNKNAEYKTINEQITKDFETIIQEKKKKKVQNRDEFQTIGYEYYVIDSIITLKITDQMAYHLGEGTTQYSIYHYDYKNNTMLNTRQMFEILGLSEVPILNAIAEQISSPSDPTEPDFDSAWFETIKWKNINDLKLYWNQKQQLVIIYKVKENGNEAEFTLN